MLPTQTFHKLETDQFVIQCIDLMLYYNGPDWIDLKKIKIDIHTRSSLLNVHLKRDTPEPPHYRMWQTGGRIKTTPLSFRPRCRLGKEKRCFSPVDSVAERAKSSFARRS